MNAHAIIGCICHLGDPTNKSGMQTLPVKIDQLFVKVFHGSIRKQQFSDN